MSKDTPPPNPAFDLGPLSEVMNDPDIANLAQQVANDPAFQQIQDLLKGQFAAQQEAPGGGESSKQTSPALPPGISQGGAGMQDIQSMLQNMNLGGEVPEGPGGINMQQYMGHMQNLMSNPKFLEMAERLGKSIIEKQGTDFQETFSRLNDPSFMEGMKAKMESMRDDPELKPVLEDLEKNGPAAMYRYWNNPAILAKFREVYEGPDGLQEVAEGEEEDDEGEEDLSQYPLIQAASDGALEELQKLLKEGQDPNQADSSGRTALHFSAGYGEEQVVTALLEAGAKLDSVDETNNTPLHYAAGYGQAVCCKQLLDKNADKTAKNNDGKTPLEVAELNNQADVIALLKK